MYLRPLSSFHCHTMPVARQITSTSYRASSLARIAQASETVEDSNKKYAATYLA